MLPAASAGRQRAPHGFSCSLVLLVGGGWYGWHWWTVGRYMVSTDDAYTEADSVTVSPQVAGYVAELRVTDNQEVRQGDVLVRIDDSTYRARVDQADAQLAAAKANVDNVGAQIERQQAAIAQAQADLDAARAQLTYAQEQSSRYGQLARSGAGTVQQQQQASSGLEQARAGVGKGQANLQAAQKDLGVLQTHKEQAQAAVRQAQAALDQARIDLGHTVVAAPIDGVVGDRAVQTGALVQPGTKLMTLEQAARKSGCLHPHEGSEVSMAGSYSTDLRERVLAAVEAGAAPEAAARRFAVGRSTAYRWAREARTEGRRAAKRMGGGPKPRIAGEVEAALLGLLAEANHLTL